MTLVRAATRADLARIAEIKVRNWEETYGPLLDRATLAPFLNVEAQLQGMGEIFSRPATLLLVAGAADEDVDGFALTYLDHGPDPWLESLHVLNKQRGRGLGTMLMRATARALRARGYATLRLGVVRGNVAAERFYEGLGAVHLGGEPGGWAEGVWHEIYAWSDLRALADPPAGGR